ncbi:hypothetical protein [Uliginosibacterium sp. TH139]|nr:hypothetical protein [Uliginosibacterium sp. TH139]
MIDGSQQMARDQSHQELADHGMDGVRAQRVETQRYEGQAFV